MSIRRHRRHAIESGRRHVAPPAEALSADLSGSRAPRDRRAQGPLEFTALVVLAAIAALLGASLSSGLAPAAADGAACPNEAIREQEVTALSLPDCRAYEQVSPVEKNLNDALGEAQQVHASPDGSRIEYYSLFPFPGGAGSASFGKYVSSFEAGSWNTDSMYPATAAPIEQFAILGTTPTLSRSLYVYTEEVTPSGLRRRGFGVRDDQTGALEQLAFGNPAFLYLPSWGSASANGDELTFSASTENLLPGVVNETGEPFLYEWSAGSPPGNRLSLVGIVNGAPVPAVAGSGASESIASNSVSETGEDIYFTDTETGVVYLRLPSSQTTVAVSAGPAQWRTATPDGKFAFYEEDESLYRFDSATDTRLLIAASTGPEVLNTGISPNAGVLGVSTDGATIYFAYPSVLANNENAYGASASEGSQVTNLYVWTEGGGINFVAPLSVSSSNGNSDRADYFLQINSGLPDESQRQAQVTPSGNVLLFSSTRNLVGYEPGESGAQSKSQFYLFNRQTNELHCITCNFGEPFARNSASLGEGNSVSAPVKEAPVATRNLSTDGTKVFFQTAEPLVPADTNGPCSAKDGPREKYIPCEDVYEWEAPDSGGSCTPDVLAFSAKAAGCLYLISSGTSNDISYFGDASADGSSVFFFTRQPLVGQDSDANIDLYDAKEAGGLAAQNPGPNIPPCVGEACRASGAEPSSSPVANSATVTGSQSSGSPPKARRKPRHQKKHHKKKHHKKARNHQQRARQSGQKRRSSPGSQTSEGASR